MTARGEGDADCNVDNVEDAIDTLLYPVDPPGGDTSLKPRDESPDVDDGCGASNFEEERDKSAKGGDADAGAGTDAASHAGESAAQDDNRGRLAVRSDVANREAFGEAPPGPRSASPPPRDSIRKADDSVGCLDTVANEDTAEESNASDEEEDSSSEDGDASPDLPQPSQARSPSAQIGIEKSSSEADSLSEYVALKLEIADMKSAHDLLWHRYRLAVGGSERLQKLLQAARKERDIALEKVEELNAVIKHSHDNTRKASEQRDRLGFELERLKAKNERLEERTKKSEDESKKNQKNMAQFKARHSKLTKENISLKRRLQSLAMTQDGDRKSVFNPTPTTEADLDHNVDDPTLLLSGPFRAFQSFRIRKATQPNRTDPECTQVCGSEQEASEASGGFGGNAIASDRDVDRESAGVSGMESIPKEAQTGWFGLLLQRNKSLRNLSGKPIKDHRLASDRPGLSGSTSTPNLMQQDVQVSAPPEPGPRRAMKKQVSWNLPRLRRDDSTDDIILGEGAYDTADPAASDVNPNEKKWEMRRRRSTDTTSSFQSEDSSDDKVIICQDMNRNQTKDRDRGVRPQLGKVGKSIRNLGGLLNGSGDNDQGGSDALPEVTNLQRVIMEQRESGALLRRDSNDSFSKFVHPER